MVEQLAALIGCVVIAGLIALVTVPFIALQRTRRIDEILDRLRALEREVRSLKREAKSIVERTEDVSLEPAAPIAVPPLPETTAPPPIKYDRRPRAASAPPDEWTAIDWEAWLGGRALAWAAIVLLLFATAFFFKELFERNLIGPLGRVSIGLAFGCAACLAGYRQHRKGWPITCQMLTAGGIVLLYLSVYASFGYYRLLPSDDAGVYLFLIVAQAFALAALYEAPSIAFMAILGGLLNPILLQADEDRYIGLFTYLSILNAGVAGLLLVRRWRGIALLSIVGTNLLFWLWYEQNYHPSKLGAAVAFHVVLAAIWISQQILGPMTRFASLDVEEAVRMLTRSLFTAAAGYVLLDPRVPDWMGTIALGAAIVHAALTWLVLRRRPGDSLHAACEWTLAMGFLAAVMPLQASAPWVPVCWAVQGLALWWFSLKIGNLPLRGMGCVLLGLAALRFVFRHSLDGLAHRHPFMPLFNEFALTGLCVAGCLLAAAVLARRLKPANDSLDFLLARAVGLAGLFLLWVIVSCEAYDYFHTQRNLRDPAVQALLRPVEIERNREDYDAFIARRDVRLAKSSQVALSTAWGMYAFALLTLGLRLPSRPLRWCALALFAVTLAKVMLIDMENLPGLYRVAAFFGLSLMTGAAAWGYQKVKLSLLVEQEEKDDASPI